MNKNLILHGLLAAGLGALLIFPPVACSQAPRVRHWTDTVGFSHLHWQMDSVVHRILRQDRGKISEAFSGAGIDRRTTWKLAISPHDDYAYAGHIYPLALSNLRTRTVIVFGVAHKAKLKHENKLVFDGFDAWLAPYGNIKASPLRGEIMKRLPSRSVMVDDSLQQVEHSVEAEVPFLQYYNKVVQIVPILVPHMSYDTIAALAGLLAGALKDVMEAQHLEWGRDISFLVSNDATHYGDEDWGGKNMALFGSDSAGYRKAMDHEHEIIAGCLEGGIDTGKVRKFTEFTVEKENFRTYKWYWCGRYSIPMGLMTALKLTELTGKPPLKGHFLGYSNSIDHPMLKVDDLRMGVTAPARLRHWVGYVAMGYL